MANRTPPHFLSTRAMAMVLAGDAGASLDPLTRDRAKPAVPFGGRYRIIDFCLSNLVNSGILKLKVLTQYKSNSLNRHISSTWRMTDSLGHYCDTVPAQMRTGQDWYRGSADAIFQNVNLIQDEAPDHVFVFGADHIYQMEVQQMLEAHVLNRADCTVAVVPVPIEEGSRVGVVEVDAEWRVKGFVEKPANPKPLPGDPTRCLASMGNYVFTTDALIREVTADAADENSRHDFGHSILTAMHQRAAVYAYDFFSNVVPGQGAREKGYWRDVGSLDTYYQCNMDLVGVEPVFNLYNDRWPILTAHSALPPAKFVFNDVHHSRVGHATDSLVSEGCIVSGSWVHRSVLAPRVRINSYAEVGESILLDGVRVGRRAIVRRAIIDKHVQVPEGMHIGVDPEEDRRRFTVTPGGVVVIPKGAKLG